MYAGKLSSSAAATAIYVGVGRSLPQPVSADAGTPAVERLDPATQVQGQISSTEATLQYASPRLARYAATLLPPLGDYLPSDVGDPNVVQTPLQSERVWGQPQAWTAAAPAPITSRPRRHAHR